MGRDVSYIIRQQINRDDDREEDRSDDREELPRQMCISRRNTVLEHDQTFSRLALRQEICRLSAILSQKISPDYDYDTDDSDSDTDDSDSDTEKDSYIEYLVEAIAVYSYISCQMASENNLVEFHYS
jgi:hypothetical protein